jgi:hypothetical protein
MTTYAEKLEELQRLRAEVRRLERQAEAEAKAMGPLSESDERSLMTLQARADETYREAGRIGAPPPLGHERPAEFRMRLVQGLQRFSPKWRNIDLANARDAGALDTIEAQIYADARKFGRTADLKPGEIRERHSTTGGGHRVIEFDGGEGAHFTQEFRRLPRFGLFKTEREYHEISKNNMLSKITSIVPGWARTLVGAPRAGF